MAGWRNPLPPEPPRRPRNDENIFALKLGALLGALIVIGHALSPYV